MKLRSMNAEVIIMNNIKVQTGNVDENTYRATVIKNAIALQSYDSVVALFDIRYCTLYLLPRFNYSPTTWKHLHAFIDDICVKYGFYHRYADDIRKEAYRPDAMENCDYCAVNAFFELDKPFSNWRNW